MSQVIESCRRWLRYIREGGFVWGRLWAPCVICCSGMSGKRWLCLIVCVCALHTHEGCKTHYKTHCKTHCNTHTATRTLQHAYCNTHTATHTTTRISTFYDLILQDVRVCRVCVCKCSCVYTRINKYTCTHRYSCKQPPHAPYTQASQRQLVNI